MSRFEEPVQITRNFAPLIPYAAVLLGMYWLGNVWIAAIAYHAGSILVLWLDRKQQPRIGSPRTSWALASLVLAVGFLTEAVMYLVIPFMEMSPDTGARLHSLGLTSWPVFILYYCLANPVLEELLWRWKLGSPSTLPTHGDLFFAGYHVLVLAPFLRWPWLVVVFALVGFAGWMWRQCAVLKRGLVLATVSHLLADIGIVLAASRHFPV